MFEAQLAIHKTASDDYSILSPWFPAGGDSGKFEIEVVAAGGSPSITIDVLTKTKGLSGDGGAVGTSFTKAGVGNQAREINSELKDLVRYKFTVTGTTAGDWTLFRMRQPKWFDEISV